MMKFGARALKQATNEFAIKSTSQTMRTKQRKASGDLLRPMSQYTGTEYKIATINKKGRKTIALAMA